LAEGIDFCLPATELAKAQASLWCFLRGTNFLCSKAHRQEPLVW